MSRPGVMPMESYRLAQYAVQVPCYICEGGNNFDAELCRHCQAPMALSHQAHTQNIKPQMIATLGSADAGKTVYLGMLTDILSRQNDDLQLLARGAFSVSLQQMTVSALADCEFPTKTPNEPDRWNWVHCQVKSRQWRSPVELIMPDLPGEAIFEEVDHPHTYPVIHAFLSKCSGVLILVDAMRLEQGEKDQDFFAMKLLSYLCEMDTNPKSGWGNRAIGLIFTKADQCSSCFRDPADFARKHAPGLWQHCYERIKRHRFFASGVAGACAYKWELGGRKQIPLRIEPRGVVDPFAWLVDLVARGENKPRK
jgi:hypothetical protein